MDDPSIRTIAQGTLITCESVFPRVLKFVSESTNLFVSSPALVTGLPAGVLEAVKGRPPGVAASVSALNGGVVAATFFSRLFLPC